MKKEILDRIKELGGNIDNVKGGSLLNDFQNISFDTVLYPKPKNTPWESDIIKGKINLVMRQNLLLAITRFCRKDKKAIIYFMIN